MFLEAMNEGSFTLLLKCLYWQDWDPQFSPSLILPGFFHGPLFMQMFLSSLLNLKTCNPIIRLYWEEISIYASVQKTAVFGSDSSIPALLHSIFFFNLSKSIQFFMTAPFRCVITWCYCTSGQDERKLRIILITRTRASRYEKVKRKPFC